MSRVKSVLIVDDNEPLADTLAQALRSIGFDARTAYSGIDGYSSFFRNSTDWVVTDIEMPELTGIDMMRCIRAIQPSVKTIYMTGAGEKYDALLSRESREYTTKLLYKPFSLNLLFQQMASQQQLPSKASMKLYRVKPAPRAF